jgi:hypothetical protein
MKKLKSMIIEGMSIEEARDLMADLDFSIQERDFPFKIKGCTVRRDGKFLILVNRLLDDHKKKKAIIHELDHIMEDDFCKGKTIAEKEAGKEGS